MLRFVVVMLLLVVPATATASLEDCIDATCRVHEGNSMGTGCVFEVNEARGVLFVLTNRHVVSSAQRVECVFWQEGHQSIRVPGRVIVRSAEVDAAVVAVPISAFPAGRLPTAIPLAPRGTQLTKGQTITSVGCAKGSWATAWKGHVLGHFGTRVKFTPPPADGRSGSALFDAEGTMIVGLLFARAQDDSHGVAETMANVYRALNFRQTAAGWQHSPRKILNYGDVQQCGPLGCPPNQSQLLPYRRRQLQRDGAQNQQLRGLDLKIDNLYPTLPPVTPDLDLHLRPRHPPLMSPVVPAAPEAPKAKTDWPSGVAFPIVVAGSGLGAFILAFGIFAVLNVVNSVKGGRK